MGKTGIDLVNATIADMSELLRSRKVSPVELVEATLERIESVGPKLNCFVTVTGDYALERAKEAEREITSGKYRGPMHGITYTLKDSLDTKGIRSTHGNPQGVDLKPRVSSTLHTYLEDAGAILVGKVNIDSTVFGSLDRPIEALNPWDTKLSPGGSSSGPGSATAASLCLSSVGTDGGGSVRHPAANCGIVGFRATTGRISRYPQNGPPGTPHSASLPTGSTSQAGPMTKTVEDNAIMLQVIGRYDPKDPISINEPPYDYRACLRDGMKGIRVGVPVDDWAWKDWTSEEQEALVRKAITVLEDLGAHVSEVSLPLAAESRSAMGGFGGGGVWWLENEHLYQNTDKWEGLQMAIESSKSKEEPEALRGYLRTATKRLLIRQELGAVLKDVDVIALPTGMTLGDAGDVLTTNVRGREVHTRSRAIPINALASITGYPGLSVPCGFAMGDRLPVGLQLMGRPLEESLIYRVAYAYEQATEWHLRHPPI